MSVTGPRTVAALPHLPLKSRLAPLSFQLHARRWNASHGAPASNNAAPDPPHTTETPSRDATSSTRPQMRLTASQRQYLDRALRVNHAGELAATRIYTAQTPPVVRDHPHLRPLMKHMHAQEAGHFAHFTRLLSHHRVRPTALYPLWSLAATALGWGTGLMGREAAMACTEAVETEIGEHYNAQAQAFGAWVREAEERGELVPREMRVLVEEVRRIRDEELEHLDHAVEQDAKMARPYALLTGVIRTGCRAAIWVAGRV